MVSATSAGAVLSVVTDTSVGAPVAGRATVTVDAARTVARATAVTQFGAEAAGWADRAGLWLYDGSESDVGVKPQLRPTYVVTFVDADAAMATVLVDGIDAKVALVASEHRTGQQRRVCDNANTRVNLNDRRTYGCTELSTLGTSSTSRPEGGPTSSVGEVNAAFDRLGVAGQYFRTMFGRDSFDGRGGEVNATVRACHVVGPCPEPNAFWDGHQLVFGQGWATDDVVAHEYTHAITEHASSLFYWYQSGAINEALSDIFAQFIDLQTPADDQGAHRWEIGEDVPGGAIRDMANPMRFGQPLAVGGQLWTLTGDDNGGVHTNSGPANYLAYMLYDGMPANSVTAIGASKSALLWYRVMHLLPSGANYPELVLTIKAACRELIGKSMTAADCDSVDKAARVIFGSYTPLQGNICDGAPWYSLGTQPHTLYFSDDMENGSGNWTRSNTDAWQFMPNSQINYSYAAHGRGSLNGWAWGNAGPPMIGATVQMSDPVTITADLSLQPWVSFNYSSVTNVSGGGAELIANDGSGWKTVAVENEYGPMSAAAGYLHRRASLAAYAGKTIRLGFRLASTNGSPIDWYVDDFNVFDCDYNQPGAPKDAYAYREGADLKVSWLTQVTNVPAGGPSGYHFALTYTPSIPGAPATHRIQDTDALRQTLTVPSIDPNTAYTITMQVVTDDNSGKVGPIITMNVNPGITLVCPWTAPGRLAVPWTRQRPFPGPPDGQCTRPPTPRR